MMKLAVGLVAAVTLATLSAHASAAGLAMEASALPATTRSALKADIDKARVETPELFRQVHDIARRANELDAGARRPGTPFTMPLKLLGPRALMPMLDMLAFEGHAPQDLTRTAQAALRVGLVEAVGIVRDARAVPVLAQIALRERDVDMTRAACDALGRMGTDEAFAALEAALASHTHGVLGGDERLHAILAGVGSSRSLAGTRLLAQRLAAHPDEATATAIAKALGTAGNAWAWKTLSSRTDEASVRELAARALLEAFIGYRGQARQAASNALLVVDDAHTPALIAAARRTADPENARALDTLADRFARNPTR